MIFIFLYLIDAVYTLLLVYEEQYFIDFRLFFIEKGKWKTKMWRKDVYN